jgi:hypothetical protein
MEIKKSWIYVNGKLIRKLGGYGSVTPMGSDQLKQREEEIKDYLKDKKILQPVEDLNKSDAKP